MSNIKKKISELPVGELESGLYTIGVDSSNRSVKVELGGVATAAASANSAATRCEQQADTIAAKYTKPSGGIPKTDLTQSVQASLNKADNALQSVPNTYRTAEEQDAIHDSTKQDVISDIETIRSGASLGATALQSVPNTYRTASEQDAIHDSTKADKTELIGKAGTKTGAEVFNNPDNVASGRYSHAEGGWYSFWSESMSLINTASGVSSHAEGAGTTASGVNSHAEGAGTTASEDTSHAEGSSTKANGFSSHAEGSATTASGESSHAEGNSTKANGVNSHTERSGTITQNNSEHAEGRYNKSNMTNTTFGDAGNTLHSVGNGTANSSKNAFEIMQNGDAYLYGLGGYDGTNPNTEGVNSIQSEVTSISSKIGNLSNLTTTAKTDLVVAINSLKSAFDNLVVIDNVAL